MPKHCKACGRGMARGGMARGGQAMSVGGDIGRWLGDWFQGWLGFADGGEVPSKSEIREVVADLSSKEQDKLVSKVTADLKDAIDAGEVKAPPGAPAMSIGGDIGEWLGNWVQGWLGFEDGGMVPNRARGGFEDGGEVPTPDEWNGRPLGKGERWEKIKSVFY